MRSSQEINPIAKEFVDNNLDVITRLIKNRKLGEDYLSILYLKACTLRPRKAFSREYLYSRLASDFYKSRKRHNITHTISVDPYKILDLVDTAHFNKSIKKELYTLELREDILKVLNTLDKRDFDFCRKDYKKIISLHYGLKTEYNPTGITLTYSEIGRMLTDHKKGGLCGGRVQQIEAKGLRLLRHPSRSRNLRVWMDPYYVLRTEPRNIKTDVKKKKMIEFIYWYKEFPNERFILRTSIASSFMELEQREFRNTLCKYVILSEEEIEVVE